MLNHAVFLDRDNTLNYDPGYLGDPSKVKLLPHVKEYIVKLKRELCFKLIVVSNQSGITRGLITEEEVDSVNAKVNSLLDNCIDEFVYCPHHPDFDPEEKVECRKPSPKMILDSAERHQIDLSRSYMIGDSYTDIECGINAGVKTILLSHGKKSVINELQNRKKRPNFVAQNFSDAFNFIVNDFYGDNGG